MMTQHDLTDYESEAYGDTALKTGDESISAYKEGLIKFPEDTVLNNDLHNKEQEMSRLILEGSTKNWKGDCKEINNQQEKESPGLWKLTGRKIRQYKTGKVVLDGFRDGIDGTKKALSIPNGNVVEQEMSGLILEGSTKNRKGDGKEVNHQQKKESPGLWKLTGRKIRQYKIGKVVLDGVRDGIDGTKKALSIPNGNVLIRFQESKVYKPHEKIKGVIQVNLDEPIQAHRLSVTLQATRFVTSESESNEETVFRESYRICGDQVYLVNGEFPLEVIVPRIKERRNDSFVSTLFYEFKELNKSAVKWTLFASLESPGGSLWNLNSLNYRLHVDD